VIAARARRLFDQQRRKQFAKHRDSRMNSEQLSALVVDALDDIKAQDITKLDVRGLTTVTDYMIIASGSSNRHVRALVENVAEKAKAAGHRPIGVEGEAGGEWVLLDLQEALVHVMLPKVREFYNLEKLWSLGAAADLAATDR
jgi:ribosome-associated protein